MRYYLQVSIPLRYRYFLVPHETELHSFTFARAMRAVVQRVRSANVIVEDTNNACVADIDQGLVLLVGIHTSDTLEDAQWLAGKVLKARCFEDSHGKMWAENVCAAGGQVIFVSQFTLHGSFANGNKPDLHNAMPPGPAKALYDYFLFIARSEFEKLRPGGAETDQPSPNVFNGVFGAKMTVSLANDGPVTFVLDSRDRKA